MNRIFISYKRENKDEVYPIVKKIELLTGEKCWIDLTGIESDKQFVEVIIKAINNADLVLFFYSRFHLDITDYERDWTIRELDFASDKKKRLVFINLDGSKLSDWFIFNYGRKQQVFPREPLAIENLCSAICGWLKSTDESPLTIEWVDLCLPSGTLWAQCNIGATAKERMGAFYAWGEMKSKDVFSLTNYSEPAKKGAFSEQGYMEYGGTLRRYELLPDNDIARHNLGSSWRIPSAADWEELTKYCTWEWNTINGVQGYMVKSKDGASNNWIFLPASGIRNESSHGRYNKEGFYWSRTESLDVKYARCLFVSKNKGISMKDCLKSNGIVIRPIYNI